MKKALRWPNGSYFIPSKWHCNHERVKRWISKSDFVTDPAEAYFEGDIDLTQMAKLLCERRRAVA